MDANQPTVVIAGATGNIGMAASKALAARGARVVMLGRDAGRLEAKAQVVREAASAAANDVQTLVVDFSDLASVERAANEALARFETIDGLVLSVVTLHQNGPTILSSGHEAMFATNVLGPFYFTELLAPRLTASEAIALHVVAPFDEALDWDDLESIEGHKPMRAYNRTKVMHRLIVGESARRHGKRFASVAFDPTFVIDKSDPELRKRWPKGFTGLLWSVLTRLIAKHPRTAGEPMATLVLDRRRRASMNGALYRLEKRVEKPDRAMEDVASGRRLWAALEAMIAQRQADLASVRESSASGRDVARRSQRM